MNSTQFLAQYGIAENNLSADVKDGINEVLRAASKEGLQQLGQIFQKEAQKRGIDTGTNVDKSAQDEAVSNAKAEYDAQQAEKQKQRRTILIAVAAGVLIVGVLIAVLVSRKRHNA